MLEIGRYIGNGKSSAFFSIRNNPSLGVKIMFTKYGNNAKNILQEELNIAHVLKESGISVLNYVDVVPITVPEYIDKTLIKSSVDMASHLGKVKYELMKQFFIKNRGSVVWGLVMDYIPDDSVVFQLNKKRTLVSTNRIEYIYKKEKEKIDNLGIEMEDYDSNLNIIWSESRAKLYFIDFENWDLSNMGDKDYIAKKKNRLFGINTVQEYVSKKIPLTYNRYNVKKDDNIDAVQYIGFDDDIRHIKKVDLFKGLRIKNDSYGDIKKEVLEKPKRKNIFSLILGR
ncbi:MAG: hypothetical protein ACP5N1_05640 [Candidatus Woesearchaeota archaeon]